MRKIHFLKRLLLIGLIAGYSPSLLSKQNLTTEVRDTKVFLTKERVFEELIAQQIPHPKIVLAQSILETGNYTSKLTKTHNNIFGIKGKNGYRKYNNWKDCILDYKKLFSNRYKGGDYYQFLKKIGYAEDPNYITKLKSILKSYKL